MKITPLNELPKGRYEALAADIGSMTDEKAAHYGNSADAVDKIMTILYPGGVPVEALRNALLLVRLLDKVCRIANRPPGGMDGGGESPWKDICGYSLIGAMRDGG